MASPYGHTSVVNVGSNVKVRLREPLRFVVKAASTANVSDLAAASSSVDGVTCADGDMVLLKDQSTASQNGVYAFSGIASGVGVLTRVLPIESDAENIYPGLRFYVEQGTLNGKLEFALATTGAITVDSTSLSFLAVSQPIASSQASVLGSLYDFREVDANSDVGAVAAVGGLLASDTTPILRGDANESQEIAWATGNVDKIAVQRSLPADVDGTQPVTIDLWVVSGATDAATFTVETSWDGGALVSDTADDSATKSATAHKITATVAASDVPNSPSYFTMVLTPGTHGSDVTRLLAWRLNYTRKPLNS